MPTDREWAMMFREQLFWWIHFSEYARHDAIVEHREIAKQLMRASATDKDTNEG